MNWMKGRELRVMNIKCFFGAHHWHRFATVLVRQSPGCAGQERDSWRCCRCRKVHAGDYPNGDVGKPEAGADAPRRAPVS